MASLGALCRGRAAAESIDDQRARTHFQAGESYFRDGRFREAAHEFDEAYGLSGRPELLINLAHAQRGAGEIEAAIHSLELLLERHPRTSRRAQAEEELAALRAQHEASNTPPPAPVAAALPVAQAPPETVEPASALPARAPEAPLPVAARAPVAASSAPSRSERDWRPRWPTWLAAGLTLASGAVAAGTGAASHSQYQELEDKCPDGCPVDSGLQDERKRGQTLARTSMGFIFGTVALAGVTVVLWTLDVRGRAASRTQLALQAAPGGAQTQLRIAY